MKKNTIFLTLAVVCLSSYCLAQASRALEVGDDLVSVTELTLEANELIGGVNDVLLKHEMVERQIKSLSDFIKNPEAAKMFSQSQTDDVLLLIKMRTMEVDLYGTILLDILKGVRQQLKKYITTQTMKTLATTFQLLDQQITSKTNSAAAYAGTTDVTGTNRAIGMFGSHVEFRAQMQEAINYLEKQNPKVVKASDKLDQVLRELNRVNNALTGTFAGQMFFVRTYTYDPKLEDKK
jgi:hypothetical protein